MLPKESRKTITVKVKFDDDMKEDGAVVEEIKEENYQATMIMAGDNLIHSSLYKDANKHANYKGYDFKPMYSYIKEIDMIKAVDFDLAFVVLDPRLKQFATVGIDYFINNCKAKRIFPMHFWHEHNIVLNYASNHQEVIKLKHPQSTFIF